MDISKRSHVAIFAFVLGFCSYIADACWAAVFIVSLPMDDDGVSGWFETEPEEDKVVMRPSGFKNRKQELIYSHNQRMAKRNLYWKYFQLGFGVCLGFLAFGTLPSWRSGDESTRSEDWSSKGIAGAALGFGSVIIISSVIARILPAPIDWFPDEFANISEERRAAEMKSISSMADEMW